MNTEQSADAVQQAIPNTLRQQVVRQADWCLLSDQVGRLLYVFAIVFGVGTVWSQVWPVLDQLMLPLGLAEARAVALSVFTVALVFVAAEFLRLRAAMGKRPTSVRAALTAAALLYVLTMGPFVLSRVIAGISNQSQLARGALAYIAIAPLDILLLAALIWPLRRSRTTSPLTVVLLPVAAMVTAALINSIGRDYLYGATAWRPMESPFIRQNLNGFPLMGVATGAMCFTMWVAFEALDPAHGKDWRRFVKRLSLLPVFALAMLPAVLLGSLLVDHWAPVDELVYQGGSNASSSNWLLRYRGKHQLESGCRQGATQACMWLARHFSGADDDTVANPENARRFALASCVVENIPGSCGAAVDLGQQFPLCSTARCTDDCQRSLATVAPERIPEVIGTLSWACRVWGSPSACNVLMGQAEQLVAQQVIETVPESITTRLHYAPQWRCSSAPIGVELRQPGMHPPASAQALPQAPYSGAKSE